jgi:hypothetical protein
MTTYNWYLIFNLTEFEALGLVSRTYTFNLEGVGQKEILVTKSNLTGMTYEGVYLPIGLTTASLFEIDGHASYIDPLTQNVYLGIATT